MGATRRKHRIVAALIATAAVALFVLQWTAAPRVEANPSVTRQLPTARGKLYLGEVFEGLPLWTIDPFLYSDCEPGKAKMTPTPCRWVKVTDGVVTGSVPQQVERARDELRRVE